MKVAAGQANNLYFQLFCVINRGGGSIHRLWNAIFEVDGIYILKKYFFSGKFKYFFNVHRLFINYSLYIHFSKKCTMLNNCKLF